jgi:Ca2+-binding EF-hand superfamily protein
MSAMMGASRKITLSATQSEQIREIFELFDTDGGGCIDRGELDFAMVALGFQKKQRARNARLQNTNSEMLDSMMEDGTVTLDEFEALMTGELGGRNPVETLLAVFAVLSNCNLDRGKSVEDSYITLATLSEACDMYEVLLQPRIFFE